MAIPVEVPKLGNTVEECLIAKWRKHKGEHVSAGEVVAEIETDKATFEVTAPADGTVLETFFEEGALAPVFTNLFVIGEAGESVDAFRPQAAAATEAAPAAAPAPAPAAPLVDRLWAPRARAATSGSLSPRARRFAAEHDFHPPAVTGSGPAGRVLEEDLREEYFSSPRVSSLAKKQMQAGMVLSSDLVPPATRISGIRATIARRMRESLASTAQYTLHTSANAGGLLLMRAKIKAATGVPDININDLVMFCAIQALLDVPAVNAEFIDGRIYKHREIHIGFACDTPRGLVVPVVRDAQKLTAGELSVRMKELAEQAVQGTISVDDLSGGTFTVSNMGGLGIESFTPVLNPPQVAILGVDSIQLKLVRREGRIEFIDAIGLSITLDHQVIDGAPGARFLKVVKEKIENVESLCTI
jgi:pyruvate dehydrogenase E2 component (dihydrolipoamide acetyltransferase)